ncbi:cyclin-D4-1-like [Cynara cardunculus var. scolymus]|uniref:Cyclin, C-terminal domain-containing protein n=1 Tax=Cynara cardunculus var. scolymus TaxID=59895 RepID=A0A124SGL5_CYNCS|nr:cyclin-D4-1-like [Cynara cardunculus var. scolymus]KVI06768.1 Cyclin, C-terminal domain-containing protein [Cynara cardunculus var. scolymus]
MAPSLDCLVSSLLCAEDNDSICYDDDDGDDDDGDVLWDHINHQNANQNQRFVNLLETEHSLLDFPLQTDECLNLLIEKECEQFVGFFDYLSKLKNGDLDLVARQEAVDWITKVHAHFKFGPLSVYLSINYLDRFLAVYELPAKAWMMQLLAVACLSLAAKMEETEVPLILDLQVGGSRFVFEARTIQKMELLVLTTLKWRMQAVTPFSFIDDFLGKVNDGQPTSKSLILRSTQLILCTIKEIQFLEFRPSEIAAAVATYVVGSTQISSLVQKDRVLKCVELLKVGCTMSLMSDTLTSSSMPKSPNGVLEAACLSYKTDDSDSAVGSCVNSAKRRRLNNSPFD